MNIEKPARTFEYSLKGEDQTIVMSAALFQEVMKAVPEPENVAQIMMADFGLREYIVRRVLTGNKRVKSEDDLIDLWELDLDTETVDNLILWVSDHILYFFTDTAAKSLTLGRKYEGVMAQLTQSPPSQAGSQT
jgi:hypothetical protein